MNITLKSTEKHPIRLGSFADLWRVGEYQGNPTNYSVQLLIPKDSPAAKELQDAIKQFAKDQWQDGAKLAVEKQNAGNTRIMRDGDGLDGQTADGTPKPGWAGHWRIKASSKFQPKIVDRALNELKEEDGKPYPGCAVSAQISLYAFKDKREMGVRLQAVQFYADGEPFGGGGSSGVDLSAFGPAEQAPAKSGEDW